MCFLKSALQSKSLSSVWGTGVKVPAHAVLVWRPWGFIAANAPSVASGFFVDGLRILIRYASIVPVMIDEAASPLVAMSETSEEHERFHPLMHNL